MAWSGVGRGAIRAVQGWLEPSGLPRNLRLGSGVVGVEFGAEGRSDETGDLGLSVMYGCELDVIG